MSDITKGYRTYLLTQSTVTDVCSTRIYFDELKQNATLPAVVLHDLGGDSIRHLGGPSLLARSRIQADCYGDTHDAANDLREQVRLVTEDDTNATWGTETVDHAMAERLPDNLDRPTPGAEYSRRVSPLDVIVWHVESAPTT